MNLSTVLKEKRIEGNLTQEEVADQLFVTRQTISNWENGKTLPDIDSLIDLANFYHLSLDNILLKGSDVVEDIKRKEDLARLKKNSAGPIVTTSILILLMYHAIKIDDMFVLGVCSILSLLNVFVLDFFDREEKRIKFKKAKGKSKKEITFWLSLLIIGLIVGLLAGYFNIFNR